MLYILPEGVNSANQLTFPNPVEIKSVVVMKGFLIPAKGMNPVLGWKAKKWAQGNMGDKKAHWRKGLGLGHGMVSTRLKAKTAKE